MNLHQWGQNYYQDILGYSDILFSYQGDFHFPNLHLENFLVSLFLMDPSKYV